MTDTHVNCLIIGAGFSGLSCANEILKHKKDASVRVLEASDRVGGRCLTDSDGFDLGGRYVGCDQHHVLRLAQEMGTKAFKVYKRGESRFFFGGHSCAWEEELPPLSLTGQKHVRNMFSQLDKMASSLKYDKSQASQLHALDNMTFHDWCLRTCPGEDSDARLARSVLENAFEGGACLDASQFSVLMVAAQIKEEGGFRKMMEGTIEDHKIAGGMGNLCVRLWKSLPVGLVSFNSPVVSVEHSDPSKVSVTVRKPDGAQYKITTDYLVLAIPPNQIIKIQFQPTLPQMKAEGWTKMPIGKVIKTIVHYRTAWWRQCGLSGEGTCDVGPVSSSADDHIVEGNAQPSLLGFINGRLVAQWMSASYEARKAAVLDQYAKMYQDQRAISDCVCYKEKIWMEEPYIGGGYTCIPMPGSSVQHPFEELFAPIANDRIRFAGTESSEHMSGYVDGAIKAGEREGRNVLVVQGLLPKSEYHNYKDPGPSRLIRKNPFAYLCSCFGYLI
uniref:Amine oxidase n=1 Tax=Chromera velia CCMP2878 TaxID=1169474 RepID=A0A0G4F6D1_9ALVE|eukprot:Cvel_15425.t1-p1 / transcript=Cvel_15425.t1 / gene=Cvel_15425 / organism=Chromera_velia_CCMP2878 / gene_product=Amine oxidase [flavin-containing] B, putative / transcript_product=Amine oxidase [flavin-containing] B, putative / location=Cvel_scaffold1140:42144-43640(+) / protein_length=499 / sequence_SO=supercontig / SO=protein_coding / is_pseudo=false